MPHAQWMEGVWLTTGVIGFTFTSLSLRGATRDLQRAMNNQTVGNPMALARAIVISTALQLTAQSFVIISSTAALFLAPPPPDYSELPQTMIGIVCWIGMSLTLTLVALYGLVVRTRLFSGFYERRRPSDDGL